MPVQPIMSLQGLDLDRMLFDKEEIRRRNQQRFEMEMLDRVILLDRELGHIAGVKAVREDEFWVRGHFPERPVLPGVLILETAAQLCSFYFAEMRRKDELLGFAAADEVRFRGSVAPGDELLMVGEMVQIKKRVARFHAQGFVGETLVFEGRILGMVL